MNKILKKLCLFFLAFLVSLLFLNFPKAFSREEFPFKGDFKKDELLVQFKDVKKASQSLKMQGVESKELNKDNIVKVKIPLDKSLEETYTDLKNNPEVSYVGPNYIYKMVTTPNDTYYGSQWALPKISASNAWSKSQGSASVKIAIVDTGVDLSHEDLSAKIWVNSGESGGGKETNGIDDDLNGYIDDYRGWDFYNNDNNPGDDNAHGTAVAGIAGASSNNSMGVSSIDWNAKIVPLKILSSSGLGDSADLISALGYAQNNNIDIISMSLGSYDYDVLVENAVNSAYAAGRTLVAAAGNDDIGQILYPARFTNVLAVGATNSSDQRVTKASTGGVWGSNYGPELDVTAPGINIYTTDRTGAPGYSSGNYTSSFGGTSSATPHVAGEIALIKSIASLKTPGEIMNSVRTSADKVADMGGNNFTNYFGYGRINLNSALSIYQWEFVSQWASKSLTGLTPGETATLRLTAKNVGTTTWQRIGINPLRVATTYPQDRNSAFYDGTWVNASNRPVGIPLGTDTVAPGETVTFEWTIAAPPTPGTYSEHFSLVCEGLTWLNDPGVSYYIINNNNNYQWQFVSQWASKSLTSLSSGESVTLRLTARNIGNTIWQRAGINPVRVGTTYPQDRNSAFYDGTWVNASNRPVGIPLGTDTVAPGETVTFEWTIAAPPTPGTYSEHFSLLSEGMAWMNDPGVNYYIVVNGTYQWEFVSQWASKSLTGLTPGETATLRLTAKNVGNATWFRTGAYPFRVGTTYPQDRNSAFYDGTWVNASNRPVGIPLGTDTVAPGETVTFEWTIAAPPTMGAYNEHFSLVCEGLIWLNDPGVSYYILVGGGETLEGVPMPAYSGKTAWEQHLSLSGPAEPAFTHYSISGTPILAQNGMAWETSSPPGYGAWGTPPPVGDERYYICMRWNYTSLHGQPIYAPKAWYYQKKVLVINPANNKKVIASIIEYGPGIMGRVSGLSPEAALAIDAVTDDNLNYYWALDQGLPLGPI